MSQTVSVGGSADDAGRPADGTGGATGRRRPPTGRSGRLLAAAGRGVTAARPVLFLLPVTALVAAFTVPSYHPGSPLFAYLLRVAVAGLVLVGAVAWWWAARRGRGWGVDLAPALLGGVAGLAVAGALHRTPFAPGGIAGDQSFRTAAITRFADSWHNADFTFHGLPSFYAPGYFWVLGRVAALGDLEPWRMTKYGTVAAALLVPVVSYLLWRRLVDPRVAALLGAVPLVLENVYEPYAWLVITAIVPWWLEAVHGLRRGGARPGHPVGLGLVGAALFLTYYYFFLVAGFALVVYLVGERVLGRPVRPTLRRAVAVLGVAAAASAVFWLPLAVSLLAADHPRSLANRWFNAGHASFPLPFLDASVVGAVALLGLVHLVWTARREPLSRGLLAFLVAGYLWYLVGAPAAVADAPLLSFRGKPVISLALVVAGVLALARTAPALARRYGRADVTRVAAVGALALVLFATQGFAGGVLDDRLTTRAHATALPDGSLPPYHPADARAPEPAAADLHRALTERWPGERHPVLLSDRVDLFVFYPYHGFLQWNAHYAHPASRFAQRVDWLRRLAASPDPAAFAAALGRHPYGPLDAFVLRDEGEALTVSFDEDNFPNGTRRTTLRFPRTLFDPTAFDVVDLGEVVVAVRH